MKLDTQQRAATTPSEARDRCDESGQLLTITIQAGEMVPDQPWIDVADFVHVLGDDGEIQTRLKSLV